MKIIRISIGFLLVGCCVLSCQKQLEFEPSLNAMGNVSKDSNGNCLLPVINGIYKVDSALNSTHYIDVQVDVSTPGSYSIITDTINGIYFKDTAQFTARGVVIVRLKGIGKPVSPGIFPFVVRFNNSTTCNLNVSVSSAAGGPVAAFTLTGAPGACPAPVILGSYSEGIELNANDKILISVNVTAIGDYTISTPLINGISFKATGTFAVLDTQTVILYGSGIPAIAGNTSLTVSGSTANCSFSLTINPPSGSGGTSAYAIAGGFGDCAAGSSFIGKFVAGAPFTANEIMNVEVFVSTLGTYTIYTDTVNGVYFRKTATFTTTGAQTITIPGFGTPLNTGSHYFQIRGGLSDCTSYKSFFGDGAVAQAGDYFPTSANSWWSYNSNTANPDTLYKKSEVNTMIGTFNYQRFYIGKQPVVSPYDTTHFRKSGQDIYEYLKVDTFTGSQFNIIQYSDLLFLKQDAPAGTAWESPLFSGTNFLNHSVQIKYRFQIESVGGTLMVNGNTYTNVIKVVWGGYVNVNNFGGYSQQFAAESFYAKGVGLIKFQSYPGYPNASWSSTDDLRYYQVF